jgi:hypothetical protein
MGLACGIYGRGKRYGYKVSEGKSEVRRPLSRLRHGWG